jgi:hypothetical protein
MFSAAIEVLFKQFSAACIAEAFLNLVTPFLIIAVFSLDELNNQSSQHRLQL